MNKRLEWTPRAASLDLKRYRGIPYFELLAAKAEYGFRQPSSTQEPRDIQTEVRSRLGEAASVIDVVRPHATVIKSVEGIGKTSLFRRSLSYEAFDDALSWVKNRHDAFAFRSSDQATAKLEEFHRENRSAVLIQPLRKHYEAVCSVEKVQPIDLDEEGPSSIYAVIQKEQPNVFARLEERRKNLWKDEREFSCPTTTLLMTHAMAMNWHQSVISKIWYHPAFDPHQNFSDQIDLRYEQKLKNIVFDDPELEEIVMVLSENRYDFIQKMQNKHPGWRNFPHHERLSIFKKSKRDGFCAGLSFRQLDADMRLDLARLKAVTVDHTAIPFGFDHGEQGIYRSQHGRMFYVGAKEWCFSSPSSLIFLTTESLIAEAIDALFKAHRKTHIYLDLEHTDALQPIKVPTKIEPMARADRKDSPQVTALAERILSGSEHSVVIGDGIKIDSDRVMSFQKMKGRNGLEDKDVYIIPTWLAPEKYAELNVIGQYLGLTTVIETYYQDQLNQAVGRNRGFRQSFNRNTKTTVICSNRLWRAVLSKLQDQAPRVQLFEE